MSWPWATTLRVLLVWSVLALLLFVFRIPSTLDVPVDPDEAAVLADLHIDAFVYIAMGPTAEGNNVDYSIATLREVGRWKVTPPRVFEVMHILRGRSSCSPTDQTASPHSLSTTMSS